MKKLSDCELIALLKQDPEVAQQYLRKYRQEVKNPAPNFSYFFKNYLKTLHLKKADIIRRSCMGSHAYKIIRGDQITNDRDYILCLCIGAYMQLHDIQKALCSNEMAPLRTKNTRDLIIISAVREHKSVDDIHNLLVAANEKPLIKKVT